MSLSSSNPERLKNKNNVESVSSSTLTFLGKRVSGLRNDLGKAALVASALAAPTFTTQSAEAIEPLQAPQTLPFSAPNAKEYPSWVIRNGNTIKVLYTSDRSDGGGIR